MNGCGSDTNDITVRQLGASAAERAAVLDLLDGWPFRDGRRGRVFFARYLDSDPSYQPENSWVAESDGRLISYVQIFPRRLRARGDAVPAGGIGSVFTQPEFRRRGIAERLLAAAVTDLRDRGFELSMLLATRLDWYGRLGWRPWSARKWRLVAASDDVGSVAPEIEPFEPTRDLAAVRRLAVEYGRERDGTVVRNERDWQGSLALAGDPDELFWVVRRGELVRAYLRFADLDGRWQALEWGRAPDDPEPLASLFAAAAGHVRTEGGSSLEIPVAVEAGVAEALGRLGLEVHERQWKSASPPPTWMLRVLRPGDVAVRFGLDPALDEIALLERVLPKQRFSFWPADRF